MKYEYIFYVSLNKISTLKEKKISIQHRFFIFPCIKKHQCIYEIILFHTEGKSYVIFHTHSSGKYTYIVFHFAWYQNIELMLSQL